ncbi:hypothetical protein ACFY8P_06120 [Streptomyces sp. NPDC012693]|jgi:hypothetical protein|uniref:hypothetical protein n=1 Tax=unclassified Streptomyces TaxID=2593676 RepID=UPI00202DBFC9|nr:hypothetical protein [Streptomyces sp. MSC1_001]
MSSEEPRQGWPAQPIHPPYGQQPYAPAAPPGPAVRASHRGAWIGAGATLVAAVIGVVGTYLVSTGNSTKPTPPAAQGPAASGTPSGSADGSGGEAPVDATRDPGSTASQESTGSADSSSSPVSQAPRTPPAKPAGTIEWQGPVAITYTDSKDLDSAPPVESEIDDENDFSVYPFGDHMLRPEGGAKALVWKDSKEPSHADCSGAVETLGTDVDMKLKTGLVVCARTNDGRIARLTVKELAGQASDTRGVFDVVVWSR